MRNLFLVAVLSSLVVGCSHEDPTDCVALVVVDGAPLTVGQVRNAVLLEQSFRSRINKKDISDKRLKKWRNSTAFQLIPFELAKMLLNRHFDLTGVRRTDESDAETLRRYNSRLRGKYPSLSALVASFPESEQAPLRTRLAYESRLESYRRSLADSLKVSDAELAERIEDERKRNDEARTVNSNAWARARACHDELANGADWMKTAAKYSEDALASSNGLAFAEDWMRYPVSGNSTDPVISEALKKLDVGQFTQPLDTDYGILIARLMSRDDADMACSRILFRLIDIPQGEIDGEDLRKRMEGEAFSQHMSALTNRLFKDATIKYPMGETITYEVF